MQSTESGRRVARTLAALGAVIALAFAASGTAQAQEGNDHGHGAPPLKFGIYAGGMAGLPSGALTTGPADDNEKINAALDHLQDGTKPFLVRVFTAFVDQPAGAIASTLPLNATQLATHGRKLDLVLGYAGRVDSQEPWIRWVKDMVHAYGPALGSVQVTEEANILNPPDANGSHRIREAVITGTLAADEQLRQDHLRGKVDIGMSAWEFGNPDAGFWSEIGADATPAFYKALDYVGIDMYPDFIFGPVDLSDGITNILTVIRNQSMPLAGFDSKMPIRVTENGWPTGIDPENGPRTEAQQAAKIQEAVETVSSLRKSLNIDGYEFWDLRDADTSVTDPWFNFGLMRSDYTPKPAFDVYRNLIRQYG